MTTEAAHASAVPLAYVTAQSYLEYIDTKQFPRGVDLERFKAHPGDRPPGPFRFLFVGRVLWDKGVAVLRDQSLTPEAHIALAKRWGGIDINNYFPLEGEHPEIEAQVERDGDRQRPLPGLACRRAGDRVGARPAAGRRGA